MTTKVGNYPQLESYIVYKLYVKGKIGNNQIAEAGLNQVMRSSASAQFDSGREEVDAALERLMKDNVLQRYQSGRKAWSLNPSFVASHKEELEEMKTANSEVNRIL